MVGLFTKTKPITLGLQVGPQDGKTLKLNGVGFKSFYWAGTLVFQLGYSHYIGLVTPSGVTTKRLRSRKGNLAITYGNARTFRYSPGDLVSRVIQLRRPDPYKARGIYVGIVKPTTKPGKRR